jgi:hypothetical protein
VSHAKLVSAKALTEPRGGSDFFGAASRAEDTAEHCVMRAMKRFSRGEDG